MNRLNSIASSIMDLLNSYLSGNDVCRMYLTGDIRLRQLMGPLGGIVRLDCRITVKPSFPGFVTQLPLLQCFSLSVPVKTNTVRILNVDLGVLPRTMRSLSLDFSNAFGCVYRHLSPLSKHSKTSLNLLMPMLETLNIGGQAGPPQIYWNTFFELLPCGLTELYMADSRPIPLQDLHRLPRGLVRLGLAFEEGPLADSNFDSILPPPGDKSEICMGLNPLELTHTSSSSSSQVEQAATSLFPPGVTYLRLNRIFFVPDLIYGQLPRSLEHLHVCYNHNLMPSTDLAWHKLPRGLRSFHLIGKLSRSLNPSDVALLPRNLITLVLPHNSLPSVAHLRNLPPSIENLGCTLPSSPEIFEALPRRLVFAPENLLDRIMSRGGEQAISALPPTITNLQGSEHLCAILAVDYNISDQLSRLLPPRLTSLTCMLTSRQATELLPRTLTHIGTSIATALDQESCSVWAPFCDQFPCLNSVSLWGLRDSSILKFILPAHGVQFLRLECFWDGLLQQKEPDMSEAWAKNLTSFRLGDMQVIPPLWWSTLPRSITDLEVDNETLTGFLQGDLMANPELSSEGLDSLPPKLTNLKLSLLTAFNDQILSKLPRTLTKLSLSAKQGGNASVTAAGMAKMPPLVTSCHFNFAITEVPDLAIDCWLPPSLTEMNFESEDTLDTYMANICTQRRAINFHISYWDNEETDKV